MLEMTSQLFPQRKLGLHLFKGLGRGPSGGDNLPQPLGDLQAGVQKRAAEFGDNPAPLISLSVAKRPRFLE